MNSYSSNSYSSLKTNRKRKTPSDKKWNKKVTVGYYDDDDDNKDKHKDLRKNNAKGTINKVIQFEGVLKSTLYHDGDEEEEEEDEEVRDFDGGMTYEETKGDAHDVDVDVDGRQEKHGARNSQENINEDEEKDYKSANYDLERDNKADDNNSSRTLVLPECNVYFKDIYLKIQEPLPFDELVNKWVKDGNVKHGAISYDYFKPEGQIFAFHFQKGLSELKWTKTKPSVCNTLIEGANNQELLQNASDNYCKILWKNKEFQEFCIVELLLDNVHNFIVTINVNKTTGVAIEKGEKRANTLHAEVAAMIRIYELATNAVRDHGKIRFHTVFTFDSFHIGSHNGLCDSCSEEFKKFNKWYTAFAGKYNNKT